MILAEVTAFGLTLFEWGVLAGLALGAAEVLGVSRSGRTARKENVDLRDRNATLEQEAKRMDAELASRDARIARLELRTAELESELSEVKRRDQGAVLTAIEGHEAHAGERHERMIGVLAEIRDAVKAA